jgi:benzil reductase ((S)-benzoin forming)
LAQLLLEKGDYVCGISRSNSEELSSYDNYFHILFDLQNIDHIQSVLKKQLHTVTQNNYEMVCLVNNAAMVEPLRLIQDCKSEEITTSLNISLIAPIVLTSSFIQLTRDWDTRRKVVNISSGSGVYANPSMSIYSTAKAGLNMFTRCVGAEQKNEEAPVEIIAVDPGMVDTLMQETARGLPEEQFALAKYFKDAYSAGQLLSTDEIAAHLLQVINSKLETGRIMNYLER